MHLRDRAAAHPDKPAVITSGGASLSYGELDRRSRRLARALRERGLETEDTVAILMENQIRYYEAVWAAQRSGLRYVPVNWHLLAEEIDYILEDSGAKVLLTSLLQAKTVTALAPGGPPLRVAVDGPVPSCATYDQFVEGVSDDPLPPEWEIEGAEMLYSSGTTGRPKGIQKPVTAKPPGDPEVAQVRIAAMSAERYGQDDASVYLIPGPLYHAAPLIVGMSVLRVGGTVVVMDRFDAEACLGLIERHRVTHAQFVPTMFIRMLRLPEEVRARYDVSSLRWAIHAAAPCPVDVKRAMIDWFGPILHEYYSGTEDIGGTSITSEEWLAHPGSVGRPGPGITIHILGADDEELPAGEQGRIFMEGGQRYEYHNDPVKTASVVGPNGWRTLGDIGYVDADGYLFLTDRSSNMIVSGGVNIYPQEVENLLATHSEVTDVAVIGVPNEEFGEEVRAIVQAADPAAAGPALEGRLVEYCRQHLAGYKCPKAVDFVVELPREANGKLYKRRLKDAYWQGRSSMVI
ncbi:acyl-CoA synthetase [Acidiferrimicrobium sp. IK]|uniref:acyl-CoA synthetase n=1 Tax=Acidiferrimicrobium sp. IK TaxID=2871700 RepID=UPI0039677116|nr:acyl-CoA synthetase [Acidiferrimicrobium sp. IK]